MRGREGVVDIEIAERRHAPRELGIVLFFAGVEARILEDADIARQHGRDRPRSLRSLAILDEAHRAPGQPVKRQSPAAPSTCPAATAPLGRPKCDSKQDDRAAVAELERRSAAVARSRVSSLTAPSCIGTLRSTRTSTLLPVRSSGRSSRVLKRLTVSYSFAIAAAVSTMRFEKPHSLSYQLTTRTSLPSITAVSRLSTVELAGVWMKSIETSGSSV